MKFVHRYDGKQKFWRKLAFLVKYRERLSTKYCKHYTFGSLDNFSYCLHMYTLCNFQILYKYIKIRDLINSLMHSGIKGPAALIDTYTFKVECFSSLLKL